MEYSIAKSNRTALISCSGSFTFNDHELFRELLTTLASATDIDSVLFDLSNLIFLDSAAIGMLIIANDEATARKQSLALSGARDQVKLSLEIADLKSLLTIRE